MEKFLVWFNDETVARFETEDEVVAYVTTKANNEKITITEELYCNDKYIGEVDVKWEEFLENYKKWG